MTPEEKYDKLLKSYNEATQELFAYIKAMGKIKDVISELDRETGQK